ncbi:MAG TPA: hypothetical protein PLS03_17610 [Terrimicrobiaceae bacterium]|nr:hypothetical protein [Terrimicrobiaceae bacterium]
MLLVTAAATPAVAGFTAQAADPATVLAGLREQAAAQALQIRYQLTETTTPLRLNQAAIDQEVENFRAQQEASQAQGRDETVRNFRKSLEQGSQSVHEGLFVLAPSFSANCVDYFPSAENGTIWEIRKDPDSYQIVDGETLSITRDPEVRTKNLQDILRESVGRLGRLDEKTITSLLEGKMEATRTGDQMVIRSGNLTVTINLAGGQPQLESVERVEPAHHQTERIEYSGYQDFNGTMIPTKTSAIFENAEGRTTRSFAIQNVQFGDSYEVPIINRDFGIVQVSDFRFTPAVKYFALRQIPSDSQIAEWVADPAALKKYNAAMQKLKR